ncbi:MAG: hypothetical protein ACI8UR_000858 [Natronomonas sp.]|jgi:hypothetical protein|uniref:hypothetical protein n=1 Tax=Natronomonas sp. TaxID=2184060 RepID=UPI003988AA5D
MGQGISGNLNNGWKNFERTLTDEARERSALIGLNGGPAATNCRVSSRWEHSRTPDSAG